MTISLYLFSPITLPFFAFSFVLVKSEHIHSQSTAMQISVYIFRFGPWIGFNGRNNTNLLGFFSFSTAGCSDMFTLSFYKSLSPNTPIYSSLHWLPHAYACLPFAQSCKAHTCQISSSNAYPLLFLIASRRINIHSSSLVKYLGR